MTAYLFVLAPFTLIIVIGIYLIYSAISGKGVTPLGKNALFQIKFGYKIRGFTGLFMIIIGTFMIWNILNL